jgi:hypothetical protein
VATRMTPGDPRGPRATSAAWALADLCRLNATLASLALRMMDGSASAAEQMDYAQRLIAAGNQLRVRAERMEHAVIAGGSRRCVLRPYFLFRDLP